MKNYTYSYGLTPPEPDGKSNSKYNEVYKRLIDAKVNEWIRVGSFEKLIELTRLQSTLNSGLSGKRSSLFASHFRQNGLKVQTQRSQEKDSDELFLWIRKIKR